MFYKIRTYSNGDILILSNNTGKERQFRSLKPLSVIMVFPPFKYLTHCVMLFKRHFSKNKKQKPVNFTYCKKSVKSYRENNVFKCSFTKVLLISLNLKAGYLSDSLKVTQHF